MKIALITNNNRDMKALQASINDIEPESAYIFDISLPETDAVSIGDSSILWNEIDLTGFDVVFNHTFHYENPVIPTPLLNTDWTVWQADYIIRQQKQSFLYSILQELNRRGVEIINPPDAHLKNFMKFSLLDELRRYGFSVPEIVCTNDTERADEFTQQKESLLWRPPCGRAAWQLCLKKQRNDVVSVYKPPVLLTELLEGPILRIYFIQEKPLLVLCKKSPQCTPLESFEVIWGVECPEKLAMEIARLSEITGVKWGQLFVILKGEDYFIYDIETDPIYNWMPEVYRDFLTKALAARLLNRDVEEKCPQKPIERTSLLLRRMLKILFDFEQSKYS